MRGVELELHPAPDYVSDAIRSTGDFYEADILDELARRIRGGVLVDAGAMIGNHAAFLAAFVPHAAIHAFEPVPANVELLRRNLAPFPKATVHPVALSDRPGRLPMELEPGNLGHSVVRARGSLWVDAVTLDSLELDDVRLLKVDVEGMEPQVLAGAHATIARWRPLIVIEDWQQEYGHLLRGYQVVADWGASHQTYLYEYAA